MRGSVREAGFRRRITISESECAVRGSEARQVLASGIPAPSVRAEMLVTLAHARATCAPSRARIGGQTTQSRRPAEPQLPPRAEPAAHIDAAGTSGAGRADT